MAEPEAPGDTKANIGIGIRRRIVQIQRERPCIRRIVPIAAADETALYICTARAHNIAYGSFLPPMLCSRANGSHQSFSVGKSTVGSKLLPAILDFCLAVRAGDSFHAA